VWFLLVKMQQRMLTSSETRCGFSADSTISSTTGSNSNVRSMSMLATDPSPALVAMLHAPTSLNF